MRIEKKKNYRIMKKYILSLILGTALLFTANKLSAQPGFDDDVTDTPIDGGIALVAAAGLAYGLKMNRTKK
ncbi:MAG: PID-CTERM protein-sorting domain-containing protein [Dolichospermum sp.]